MSVCFLSGTTVDGRGPDQDALARHAHHVQSRTVLQHLRASVLPDQKSVGASMDAPALAATVVPQVHPGVAVSRLSAERPSRDGGRAPVAQAARVIRHLPRSLLNWESSVPSSFYFRTSRSSSRPSRSSKPRHLVLRQTPRIDPQCPSKSDNIIP